MDPRSRAPLRNALLVYAAWTAATYLLEGLPGTLVRPEAVGLRIFYALVANLAIGIVLPLWLVGQMVRGGLASPEDFGFSGWRRTLAGVLGGVAVGYGLFHLAQTEPVHPLAVVNAFAQVWVVSVAEIVVCWGLVASTVRIALRGWHRAGAIVVASAVASVLFGIYHFAHSAPFNQVGMVVFLSGIGLATSLWWFASRDVYGTTVFHNFFGVIGVLAALKAGGLVPERPELAAPLIVTALVALVAVAWPGIAWIRRLRSARP
ncbi:MAG TPA: hypothetical protein VF876_09265 [Burkholderiales bacterium]